MLFLCPDSDVPTGGIQVVYRQVEFLNDAGISAAVLHERPGFRCSWFASEAPVVSTALRPVTQFDVLVIPEVYGPHLHEIAPGTKKVIFNQNAYLTFVHWPLLGRDPRVPAPDVAPYRSSDVVAVACVSDQNREYLEYAFPGVPVHRISYAVAIPETLPDKDDVIAFMPRKNRDHALQVLSILHQRGALDGLAVVAIDGVSHEEALATLARARVFLSFGYPEGLGMPPLEAMAAQCVVIGYDGGGGKEFLSSDTGYPVPYGDIVGYARTVEAVLDELRAGSSDPVERAEAGRALAAERFDERTARASTIAMWERVIEANGAQHLRTGAPLPAEVPVLRSVHDPQRAEIEQLRAELEATRVERDAVCGELDVVRRDLEAASARIDELLRSSSWRITRPLRAAADLGRRTRRRD